MLIEHSKIIGLSVGAIDAGKKVGRVLDAIVNPEDGRILAYLVELGFWPFKNCRVIMADDVAGIDKNGLVVQKEDDIIAPDEVVRIKKLIKEKWRLHGLPVETQKAKRRLGKVEDYLIETTTGSIVKFYIHSLWDRRIIPREQVVSIERRKLIVKDENGAVAEKAAVEEIVPA